MAYIVMLPGETLSVQFHEADGEILVKFQEDKIVVETQWQDTKGRGGVLWEDVFYSPKELEDMGYQIVSPPSSKTL